MTSDGEKLEMASADSYCEGFYFKREQRNSTVAGRGTQVKKVFAFLLSGFGGWEIIY